MLTLDYSREAKVDTFRKAKLTKVQECPLQAGGREACWPPLTNSSPPRHRQRSPLVPALPLG